MNLSQCWVQLANATHAFVIKHESHNGSMENLKRVLAEIKNGNQSFSDAYFALFQKNIDKEHTIGKFADDLLWEQVKDDCLSF